MFESLALRPLLLAAAVTLAPLAASAHAYDIGPLHVGHPWSKPTPNGAPTAVGYLTVTNGGKTADRLLGGTSPAADAVELHAMSMAGGVMRMRLLSDGFLIAPGATLTLAPGGDHLMLIGLKHALKVGDRVPATLRFAHAGEVRVEFVVQADAPAAGASMAGMAGMKMP